MDPSRGSRPPRRGDYYRPNTRGVYPNPKGQGSRSRSPPRRKDEQDHHKSRRSRSPKRRPSPQRQLALPYDDVPSASDEPLPGHTINAPDAAAGAPGTTMPLPGYTTEPPSTTAGAPGTYSAPSEAQQQQSPDDGWEPVWEPNTQAFYFYNHFTRASQWENPRMPAASQQSKEDTKIRIKPAAEGGYNPAIHGDYDPNADYAKDEDSEEDEQPDAATLNAMQQSGADYSATAQFNRFTGGFHSDQVHPTHNPSVHTDDAKVWRQMNAYYDVDAAANSNEGKSLRAERQNRKLTKRELKAFKDRKKHKKEEKKRAWLRD